MDKAYSEMEGMAKVFQGNQNGVGREEEELLSHHRRRRLCCSAADGHPAVHHLRHVQLVTQ